MEYKFNIDEITKQVEDVLVESQSLEKLRQTEDFHVSAMIEQWLEAKKYFIEHMNGELIYELDEPVSFTLDEKGRQDRINRFASRIENHYNNFKISNFLDKLEVDDFYNNLTSKEYLCGCTTIPKNFKVVKAFKFFEENLSILKEIQNEASRIIQEDVIKGKLCFSVHPLDFLSASENVHNWRSCHALDGEYRSGNLNYMVDSTTVICYLKAEKNAILPHFPENLPWNSKKWRVWLFFSNDRTMFFIGRQYPFSADIGLKIIKDEIISKRLEIGDFSEIHHNFIPNFKDPDTGNVFFLEKLIPIGKGAKPLKKIVYDKKGTYFYNDLLKSNFYSPQWSYRLKQGWRGSGETDMDITNVPIGEKCLCPICGKNYISFYSIIACETCARTYDLFMNDDDYCECDICGTLVHNDDISYLDFSDIRVCPNCYSSETSRCQSCGRLDLPEVIRYHPSDGRCLCPYCYNSRNRRVIL